MKYPLLALTFLLGGSIAAVPSHADSKTDKKPAQYRLRQILIEPSPSPEHEGEVLTKANECLVRAKSGEDFTSLARKYSQEPGAERAGGDLGFFTADQMVKSFSDAVFSMKSGEIRGPVKTQYGYHVIKLLDIRGKRRHAQHILFMLTPGRADSIAAMRTARKIRKELDDGAEFSELIEKYSTNDELRKTEGYMVWLRPDEMLDEFQKEVSGLKPGDITEPFSSILGYHVVLVDSVNYDHGRPLQGFPARIEQKLREEKPNQ
jgi:peptidyl-prolyl cis-trans isomerase SurA